MQRIWCLVGAVWLSLWLAACGGETTVSPRADQIVCTVAYRSSVEVGIEQEKTLIFTDADDEQSVNFAKIVFYAAYDAGVVDNERNLRVRVTDTSETVIHATLYQFPTGSGPQNQFVGGHGFTGLAYSYAPTSAAELQFWCEAN